MISPTRALAAALLSCLLVSIAITGMLHYRGEPVRQAFGSTAPAQISSLLKTTNDDSWGPMLRAYRREIDVPGGNIYDIFFDDKVKFQYPPTSLLVFDALPTSWTAFEDGKLDSSLRRMLSWMSRVALALTIIVSALILETGLRRLFPDRFPSEGGTGWRFLLMLSLGLTYYPLVKGYGLGQVQVFLNMFIAFAFFFLLLGWNGLGGACVGICCLVKPHYGILFLWSLLRRNWRFLAGFAIVFFPLLLYSAIRHGLGDYASYLRVLSDLSRHGEVFWPNQALNGLLNRLVGDGNPVEFSMTDLAPYHPLVHTASMIFGVVLCGLALFYRAGEEEDDGKRVLDMMTVFAGATIASLIAWEHHYGAFLAVFAFALPVTMRYRPSGKSFLLLLLLGYVMVSQVMLRPELIFRNRWLGIGGSHLFLGALLLFCLLLLLRRDVKREVPPLR